MKKADLKDGMILEHRNGDRYLVLGNKEFNELGFNNIERYSDDLDSWVFGERRYREYGVVKIFTSANTALHLTDIFREENLDLIWEREPQTFSQLQIEMLKLLYGSGFNWIARDKDGSLYAFDSKPYCESNRNTWRPKKNAKKYKQVKIPKCFDVFPLVDFYVTHPLNIGEIMKDAEKGEKDVQS